MIILLIKVMSKREPEIGNQKTLVLTNTI